MWVIWAFVLVFMCLTVCLYCFGGLAFFFVLFCLGWDLHQWKIRAFQIIMKLKCLCRSSTGWCSGWTGLQQLRSLLGVYRVAQAMHCPAPSTMLQGMVISQYLTVQSVHAGGSSRCHVSVWLLKSCFHLFRHWFTLPLKDVIKVSMSKGFPYLTFRVFPGSVLLLDAVVECPVIQMWIHSDELFN